MSGKELPPTKKHERPAPPPAGAARERFVLAFPHCRALPLPPTGAPTGRNWLVDHDADDPEVSRDHFCLTRNGGQLEITDTGSENGVWLDGIRLEPRQPHRMEDGMLVRIGSSLLVHRAALSGTDDPDPPLGELVGPFGLRAVADALRTVGLQRPAAILIEGETGTGKELLATEIANRLRPGKPREAVNLGAVPETLFESTLFGHVAGAFSGARSAEPGVIGRCDGGVVFLDELGELPLALQPKLLRALESGEISPVGGPPRKVDVLFIAATNRDLEQQAATGQFRADLLARFRHRLELPPLRERREDIFAVTRALVQRSDRDIAAASSHISLDPARCDVEAVERLMLDLWPANVRGLEAALAKIVALSPPPELRAWAVEQVLGPGPAATGVLTRDRVDAALTESAGNRTRAAALLGVSRGRLLRFLGTTE